MKRLARHTVDMLLLAERVRPDQKAQLVAFVKRSERYVQRVQSLPAERPDIDWDFYTANVAADKVSMVEAFRSAYEKLTVPEPIDTQTDQVDAQMETVRADIVAFKAASDERICAARAAIDEINAQLPFDQMTMEDFIDTFPGQGPDFLNRPTFWPHTVDEQPPIGANVVLAAGEAIALQRMCGLRERIVDGIEVVGQRKNVKHVGAVDANIGDFALKANL